MATFSWTPGLTGAVGAAQTAMTASFRKLLRRAYCGLDGGHKMVDGKCSACDITYEDMALMELREICPAMFEDPLDTEYHRPSRHEDCR